VLLKQNHPLVELLIDGKAATFLPDIGAERTTFADTAVQKLGLARDPMGELQRPRHRRRH